MLKIRELKKSFRQPNGELVSILDVPEYSVDSGEQAVLVGPSGGGKTTLLHIIAGITRPDAGSVLVAGKDFFRFSESGRDRIRASTIGYVFQTFNLLPAFSALENVELGMTFSGGKNNASRAKELLKLVGLGHRLKNKPGSLSVGEQQRVAVARALANRPKLLLADEPTANVDPANQQQIVDLICKSCEEENISLVMVTHSNEVSQQFSRVDKLNELNLVMQTA
ncbi:ABC transporter ATP-binding protein [Mariniblastus sp.]|jgi:ABC-type lipoprotein export system ATPase subunit|nr:ABC transporter ATP-binding protein [Mariniblastus sp.]MDB4756126.1 ABC transporter ATP-binding protein [Mariniblastus sp.]